MKGFGEKPHKKNINFPKNKQKLNNEILIKKAFELQAQGSEIWSSKYYANLIEQGVQVIEFSNYGIYLNEIGKHKEAELKLKKQFLNPAYANAYYNLAVLFIGQRNSKRAELELRKAIKLKSDFAIAIILDLF